MGCIAAKRNLGEETIQRIDAAIRRSLEFANHYPEKCLPYIRRHSQEIDKQVVQNHIDLYVNEFSLNLGVEGVGAIESFLSKGRMAGILPHSDQPLMF